MASPIPARTLTGPPRSGALPLVIGIGNPLRGDDAVGPLLAARVGGRGVHQLTPELAADLAPLKRVLFIDAWLAPAGAVPRLDPLQPGIAAAAGESSSHRLDPAQLLALSRALYGEAPPGWWLRIPAHDFGHGAPLSADLRRSLSAARALLRAWLADTTVPHA